jgi:hypothetical protein
MTPEQAERYGLAERTGVNLAPEGSKEYDVLAKQFSARPPITSDYSPEGSAIYATDAANGSYATIADNLSSQMDAAVFQQNPIRDSNDQATMIAMQRAAEIQKAAQEQQALHQAAVQKQQNLVQQEAQEAQYALQHLEVDLREIDSKTGKQKVKNVNGVQVPQYDQNRLQAARNLANAVIQHDPNDPTVHSLFEDAKNALALRKMGIVTRAIDALNAYKEMKDGKGIRDEASITPGEGAGKNATGTGGRTEPGREVGGQAAVETAGGELNRNPEEGAAQASQNVGTQSTRLTSKNAAKDLTNLGEILHQVITPAQTTWWHARNAQENAGKSDAQLAQELGFSKQNASKLQKNSKQKVVKDVAKMYGITPEEAEKHIVDYLKSKRTVQEADETKIGMSPEAQNQAFDHEALFGNEAGGEPTAGIIDSAKDSQMALGEDKEATALAAQRPDPVYEARVAEGRQRIEAQKEWVLSRPEAADAAEDWDDMRGEGAPEARHLTRDDAYEWTLTYAEWKDGQISQKELDDAQREIERRYGGSTKEPALGGREHPEDGAESPGHLPNPEAEREDSEAAGELSGDEPEHEHEPQPLEQYAAQLRDFLDPAGKRRLDRIIQRYSDGDIDLDRLQTELETLDSSRPSGGSKPEGNAASVAKSPVEAYEGKRTPLQEKVVAHLRARPWFNRLPSTHQRVFEQLAETPLVHALARISAIRQAKWLMEGTAQYDAVMGSVEYSPAGEFLYGDAFRLLMAHELAHAVDATTSASKYTPGKRPEFAVAFTHDGGLDTSKPLGEMAKELYDAWKTAPAWSRLKDMLDYPFSNLYKYDREPRDESDRSREIRGNAELFAQASAMYHAGELSNDGVMSFPSRDELKTLAPKTAAYLEKFYADYEKDRAAATEGYVDRIAGTKASQAEPERASDIRPNGSAEAHAPLSGGYVPPAKEREGIIERTIAKLPKDLQAPVEKITDAISNLATKGLYKGAFLHDLVDVLKGGLPSVTEYYRLLVAKDTTRRHLEAETDRIAHAWDGLGKRTSDAVSKFVEDATRGKKWFKKYDWYGKPVTIDKGMEARYKGFSPEARKVIDDIFKHGNDQLLAKMDGLKKEIIPTYKELMAEAKTDEERQSLTKEMEMVMRKADAFMEQLDGPYAPLRRFGDYVMVYKSKMYRDMEARAEQKDPNAAKWMEENEPNENHYVVEQYETRAEAKAAARGMGEGAEAFAKADWGREHEIPWQYMKRISSMAEEHFGKDSSAARRAVKKAAADLYLTYLTDTSGRKAELRRRNITARNFDMKRAFAANGRANAHLIASVQHSGAVSKALTQMAKEVKTGIGPDGERLAGDRMSRSQGFNAILDHHTKSLSPGGNPWQQKAMAVTSLWQLLGTPKHYIQGMSQPFMMTLPVLEGRFGTVRAWNNFLSSYRDLAKLITAKGAIGSAPIDISKHESKVGDERGMLEYLRDNGMLDVGIDGDLGRFDSHEGVGKVMFGVVQRMGMLERNMWSANGIAAGLAAYRMAYKDAANARMTHEEAHTAAQKYALDINRQTLGDWTGAGAPMAFKTLPKLVTQYRKFQLVQLSYFARLAHDVFKDASPKERGVASKTMAWALAHHAVMAGIKGLPAAALISWVVGQVFGDDSNNHSGEAVMREAIGDDDLADMILNGVPNAAGVNMEKSVGAGDMLDPTGGYGKIDISSRDKAYETLVGLSGPFIGGLTNRVVDGFGYMHTGNYYKGIETMLPNAVADGLKAYRLANEGVTNKQGDVMIAPDDMHAMTVVAQALGLSSTELTRKNYEQGQLSDLENHFKDMTTVIKDKYTAAYKDGDTDKMADLRDEWYDMNDARKAAGFKTEPLSQLVRAPMQQMARERMAVSGVGYKRGEWGAQNLIENR